MRYCPHLSPTCPFSHGPVCQLQCACASCCQSDTCPALQIWQDPPSIRVPVARMIPTSIICLPVQLEPSLLSIRMPVSRPATCDPPPAYMIALTFHWPVQSRLLLVRHEGLMWPPSGLPLWSPASCINITALHGHLPPPVELPPWMKGSSRQHPPRAGSPAWTWRALPHALASPVCWGICCSR